MFYNYKKKILNHLKKKLTKAVGVKNSLLVTLNKIDCEECKQVLREEIKEWNNEIIIYNALLNEIEFNQVK